MRTKASQFTKNHVFFDLGFDVQRSNDTEYIEESISKIEKMFHLVAVADHFDESMVLLSDLLCWPIEEFACFTLNARASDKRLPLADEERIRDKVGFV